MDAIKPFTRAVTATGKKPFSGGSKFEDGDVLMARITPCLENGKTAVYRTGPIDGPAAGSTEFIVVRGRKGVSDSLYAYYVLTSEDVRVFAISQMSGSTGRQRVQKDMLVAYELDLPPLPEQRGIAATLGALDDKIESNRRSQITGEQLLRALVEKALACTNGGNANLGDYCSLVKEQVKADDLISEENYIGLEHMPRGAIFLNGWDSAAGLGSHKSRFQTGDVLFGKLRPYFKKVGIAPISGVCSTDILVLRPTRELYTPLVVVVASSDALIASLSAAATGTRMPRASWDDLAEWSVPRLSEAELMELADECLPLLESMTLRTHENRRLAALRNTLLPELLSGRIRVPEAEEAVAEVVA